MKALRIAPFLLLLGVMLSLTGCETLNQGDRALLAQHHVATPLYNKMLHNEQLALEDITELSKRGLAEQFIINYLRSTYAVYQLSSSDVTRLVHDGVAKPVIDYMLSTPTLYGPRAVSYPYDYPGIGYGPYSYYDYGPPVIVIPCRAFPHGYR